MVGIENRGAALGGLLETKGLMYNLLSEIMPALQASSHVIVKTPLTSHGKSVFLPSDNLQDCSSASLEMKMAEKM